MADNSKIANLRPDPAKFKLGKASAARLSELAGIDAGRLAGKTIGEIAKAFPFEIDPRLFLFRRICGTVVKTDPVSGIDYPVPFATVQVEDTDCSFLGYFPTSSPWSWFFPFNCRREVIATVKTDACGKFCVWIPRFDIDWVLRWRRVRKCFPIIFDRPNLRDIIDRLIPERIPHFPPEPIPGPDPAPFGGFNRGEMVTKVANAFGRDLAVRAARLSSPAGFGVSTLDSDAAELAPALMDSIAPPLPPEVRLQLHEPPAGKSRVSPALATVAQHLSLDPKSIAGVDLRHFIGPFKRCYDIFLPTWSPILDVPDITFRVLQDTNGDGVEEQIYGEGHFQVRWNAGSLSNLVLHAGPNAIAAPLCGPETVPCGNQAAIVLAGRLPLIGGTGEFDAAAGYARKTNRPHPSGLFSDPLPVTQAASPLRGLLSLYGCNKTDPAATHYRLTYQYSADGVSFGDRTPFLGYTWPLFRLNGGIGQYHYAAPDSKGWYPLALPPGPAWLPQDLLLDWPSATKADGLYSLRLELGVGGADVPSSQSGDVMIMVDNSRPYGDFDVRVGTSPAGPFTPIDQQCPVVRRGTTPVDLYFRVTLPAAARHLRSARIWASGCGAGDFAFVSGTGGHHAGSTLYEHWHTSVADNDQTLQVLYRLPAGAAEGTYSFNGEVIGRAFNPLDGGHLATPPWETNTAESWHYPTAAFSVFNANP